MAVYIKSVKFEFLSYIQSLFFQLWRYRWRFRWRAIRWTSWWWGGIYNSEVIIHCGTFTLQWGRGRLGRDHVGFTTTCSISNQILLKVAWNTINLSQTLTVKSDMGERIVKIWDGFVPRNSPQVYMLMFELWRHWSVHYKCRGYFLFH
jgi:hypothetical protein